MKSIHLRMAISALGTSLSLLEEATGISYKDIACFAYFNGPDIDTEKLESYFNDRGIFFGRDYIAFKESE